MGIKKATSKESGLRLKSLGEYTVNYNNEGLYDSIAHNGYLDDYAFQYGPNKIRKTHDAFYNYVTEFAVNYDKMGRLTSYESHETGDCVYFESKWNGTGSATYTYDNEGHLTSMTQSGGEDGIEKGEPYTSSWIEKVTLTWENGLLKEIAYEDIGLENARTWSAVYTFGYDTEYVNKYKQWVYFYVFGDNNTIFLPYLGLMGDGVLLVEGGGWQGPTRVAALQPPPPGLHGLRLAPAIITLPPRAEGPARRCQKEGQQERAQRAPHPGGAGAGGEQTCEDGLGTPHTHQWGPGRPSPDALGSGDRQTRLTSCGVL